MYCLERFIGRYKTSFIREYMLLSANTIHYQIFITKKHKITGRCMTYQLRSMTQVILQILINFMSNKKCLKNSSISENMLLVFFFSFA